MKQKPVKMLSVEEVRRRAKHLPDSEGVDGLMIYYAPQELANIVNGKMSPGLPDEKEPESEDVPS
jgi:hypothetical protein